MLDSAIESEKFSYDEKYVKQEFTSMGFKSIVEKSWPKWNSTMGRLNERREDIFVG